MNIRLIEKKQTWEDIEERKNGKVSTFPRGIYREMYREKRRENRSRGVEERSRRQRQ